jgi:putative DNA primase/helicase
MTTPVSFSDTLAKIKADGDAQMDQLRKHVATRAAVTPESTLVDDACPFAINLESIPEPLKALPQWVCWQRERRDGKPTKVPYDAKTGACAKVNDPSTWGTFAQVTAALDHYAGIGFVLTKEDPFVGVDLDHAVDPGTGRIEPWALAIVDQLHSYTEISPSGTGLRIFLQGTLPPGRRRKGLLELYDCERYLTLTGRHLAETPRTIEARQETLQRLHAVHFPPPRVNGDRPRPAQPVLADDRTQLDRMFRSKGGAKIQALWNGNWSAYPSQSEADSALAFHLAFWFSRDASRIDQLFRQSGLFRPKWDEPHGERTYGAMTLARACASCSETYTPPRPVRPQTPDGTPPPGPTAEGAPSEATTDAPSAKTDDHAPHEQPAPDGDPGLTKTLADDILRTEHFAQDAGGQLYAFVGGTYRPNGEEWIAQRVKAILVDSGDSKRWSSHRVREVVEFLRVDAPRLWDRPPSTVLNLVNGLLVIDTQTLHPHSPDHLTAVQLPVTYDPTATCPLWESFAARVLPSDCQSLPFELGASSMCGDVSDQKAVLLVGSGENGKSTLLLAIVSFLGRENVSSLALQRLEIDKFSVVRLLGKLANICADLPSEHLTSTSKFKALTGGDPLPAERKFQGSFEFIPFARLIFSANHYPQSKDASHAFFRRWNVVPFDVVLDPHEKIQNFAAHLSTPGELSGVLNRTLAVLPGMIQRGGFTRSESTQAALMEFREMTDPLAAWLDRCTVVNPEGQVTRKDLTIVYNAASETAGRPPMTSKAFCAAVRRLRPTVKDAQRTIRGEVKDVFLGLTLRVPSTTPTIPDGLFPEEVVDDDH